VTDPSLRHCPSQANNHSPALPIPPMMVTDAAIPTASKKAEVAKDVVVSAPGKVLLCGGYLILQADDGGQEEAKRHHAGIVLAVNKRFYCHGQLRVTSDADITSAAAEEEGTVVVIRVESPQYGESYEYMWQPSKPRNLRAFPDSPHRNAFVEHTVRICCDNYTSHLRELLLVSKQTKEVVAESSRAAARSGATIRLVIQGDNEFWSHPTSSSSLPRSDSDPPNEEALSQTSDLRDAANPTTGSSGTNWRQRQKLFRKAPRGSDGSVMKTGLGSSACLVTSLVAAVDYLLCPDVDPDGTVNNDTATIHNCAYGAVDDELRRQSRLRRIASLAQLCHCVAQGKIGSGFDVSAACWGSHLYRRFDDNRSADWFSSGEAVSTAVANEALPQLSPVQAAVQDLSWTEHCVVSPIPPTLLLNHRPGALEVILADTAGGGSSSPGMSRMVLRHVGSDAWNELANVNRSILELWNRATSLDVTDLERESLASRTVKELMDLGRTPSSESNESEVGEAVRDAARRLGELSIQFQRWRISFKALGTRAGADLEPDAQSSLADSTEQLAGVVTAVVPGAGGHDALACLYVNCEATRRRIVEHWSSRGVPALDVRIVPFGDGVRLEEDESLPSTAI
jgi:phosphomevalonate kinase